MVKTLDIIVGASIILGVGGASYYYWDDLMGEKPPGMPNYDHEIGGGSKKTRRRRYKKNKSSKKK